MRVENRTEYRVEFKDGYMARIMSIDGTWQRRCYLLDISQNGARIQIDGEIGNLNLDEFFLIFSSFGTAHRRCQMAWLNGDQLGTRFLQLVMRSKRTAAAARRSRLAGSIGPNGNGPVSRVAHAGGAASHATPSTRHGPTASARRADAS